MRCRKRDHGAEKNIAAGLEIIGSAEIAGGVAFLSRMANVVWRRGII